jgi:hypothetical protein
MIQVNEMVMEWCLIGKRCDGDLGIMNPTDHLDMSDLAAGVQGEKIRIVIDTVISSMTGGLEMIVIMATHPMVVDLMKSDGGNIAILVQTA